MPVIKSAQKKLRQDVKRTGFNTQVKEDYKTAVKKARKSPSVKTVGAAYSELDMAVKKNVIHKNKASRLKSQLAVIKHG
jgi:small subunit ribosomal protein S20